MIRLLARCAFLFLAVVVMLWRLLSHDAPLSVVLIALPLLSVALAPASALGTWIGRAKLMLAALLGAGLWLMHALTLRSDGEVLSLVPLLGQLWSAAGFGLLIFVVGSRLARLPVWWLRLPALIGLGLAVPLVVLPLTRLYRVHATPRVIDAVFTPGERFDLHGPDGVRLHCRWWSPAAARGVVVFTHGVGGSFDQFIGVHALFAQQGWAVLDWNLRGHGRSAPAATTYGWRESEDLLVVWAEAQRRAQGLPLVAYGASLGGAATLLAAPRLGGCRGLVLESCFAELAPLIGPNLPGPLAISARWLGAWGLGLEVEQVRPIAMLRDLRDLPLLLGTALDDRIVPPEHGRCLAEAAPWATHVCLADRGHMDLAYDQRWRTALAGLLRRAASASR